MSLFSVRKSAKRNFRKKVEAEEDDEEKKEAQENPPPQPEKRVTKPEVKAVPSAPRSLLSFEEDIGGDGTEFKVKKTNYAKRIAKMMEREKEDSEPLQAEEQESSEDERPARDDEAAAPSGIHLTQRLSEGFIPDAATIHAFRKKREVARKLGGSGADFMTLEGGQPAPDVAAGKSRLVREDENDKSDSDEEDEGGKGARTFGKADGPSKQMRVISALENVATDSEDEETRRWEEEQINKGVKVIAPQKLPVNQTVTQEVIEQSFLYGAGAYPLAAFSAAGIYEAQQEAARAPPSVASRAPQMPENLVPITVESLKSRLQRQLEDIRHLHSTHTQRLQQIVGDLAVAEKDISRVESLSSTVGKDYVFYQEMRGYLRDQLYCLAEKLPMINKLDKAYLDLLRQKTQLIMERRRQDIADESVDCGQFVGGVRPELDEAHQRRAVEREGRRRRRREKREKEKGKVEHFEGLSSDDEIAEIDRMKLVSNKEDVVAKSKLVFGDVLDEFHKLPLVKEHYEQWKWGFNESYKQAYISLCLPRLFDPFVKLEMIDWNPLEDGCKRIEDMEWFQVLMFYGYRNGTDLDTSDEDLELIPRLVDLVVIPKLTGILQHAWDPLSSTQTTRVVSLIRQLAEDYPTVSAESKATQKLFSVVLQRIKQSTAEDVFIPLVMKGQLDNETSLKYLFYQRQFWMCLKLLDNITQWTGLIAPDTLQEIVLDGLLNRYLLMSLQNSPPSLLSLRKAEAIISKLPELWYMEGSTVTRPLLGLGRYLVHLATVLYRSTVGHPDIERQQTRLSIERIVKLLRRIHADDLAGDLVAEYKLSEQTQ